MKTFTSLPFRAVPQLPVGSCASVGSPASYGRHSTSFSSQWLALQNLQTLQTKQDSAVSRANWDDSKETNVKAMKRAISGKHSPHFRRSIALLESLETDNADLKRSYVDSKREIRSRLTVAKLHTSDSRETGEGSGGLKVTPFFPKRRRQSLPALTIFTTEPVREKDPTRVVHFLNLQIFEASSSLAPILFAKHSSNAAAPYGATRAMKEHAIKLLDRTVVRQLSTTLKENPVLLRDEYLLLIVLRLVLTKWCLQSAQVEPPNDLSPRDVFAGSKVKEAYALMTIIRDTLATIGYLPAVQWSVSDMADFEPHLTPMLSALKTVRSALEQNMRDPQTHRYKLSASCAGSTLDPAQMIKYKLFEVASENDNVVTSSMRSGTTIIGTYALGLQKIPSTKGGSGPSETVIKSVVLCQDSLRQALQRRT